jgi:hypothetical protein
LVGTALHFLIGVHTPASDGDERESALATPAAFEVGRHRLE